MCVSGYTPGEIMVVAAARQIRDGETVFVGMRLPLVAFHLAKETHAPRALGVFEAGVVRDRPASQPSYTMGTPPNIAGASWATGLIKVLGCRQREGDRRTDVLATAGGGRGRAYRCTHRRGTGDRAGLRSTWLLDRRMSWHAKSPTPPAGYRYGPPYPFTRSIMARAVLYILLGR